MAFGGSGFFTATVADVFGDTADMDWGGGTWNIALYNNTATPDFTVTSANTAYNAGVWASNEVTGTGWSAGGPALTTSAPETEQPAAGQVRLDATDVSESGTTLSNARGALIYMGSITTPVADQGLLVVDFGSDYSTTNGTFAITWHANGVAYYDVW